jgi:hypothetical protein
LSAFGAQKKTPIQNKIPSPPKAAGYTGKKQRFFKMGLVAFIATRKK